MGIRWSQSVDEGIEAFSSVNFIFTGSFGLCFRNMNNLDSDGVVVKLDHLGWQAATSQAWS